MSLWSRGSYNVADKDEREEGKSKQHFSCLRPLQVNQPQEREPDSYSLPEFETDQK